MVEEKQGLEQLSQDDLNNVKAGIPPYESPLIVDLSNSIMTDCYKGIGCSYGFDDKCKTGTACNIGQV